MIIGFTINHIQFCLPMISADIDNPIVLYAQCSGIQFCVSMY